MSLRRIAPGEELTYDYNLYDGDEDDASLPLRSQQLPQDHVLAGRNRAPEESRETKSLQEGGWQAGQRGPMRRPYPDRPA